MSRHRKTPQTDDRAYPHLRRDFVGYGQHLPEPMWPNGARLALNIAINFEEGSEPGPLDGDRATETGLTEGGGGEISGRDLAAESMFEYGSRVGFWRVMRLMQERGLTGTIFGCALALERNPQAAKAIRDSGFDVCAHGWRWERHTELTIGQEREHIKRAVDSLTQTIGERPLGWYCRYGPSVNTRRLLVEEGGFLYDCDAYNDELPYWTLVDGKPHLVIPYGLTNNDAKFIRGGMSTASQFFELLRDAFDLLYAEGATQPRMMSVGLHLRIAGHPGRAAGLARFLDHVISKSDVWICRRLDIARHWHANHSPQQQAHEEAKGGRSLGIFPNPERSE